MGLRTGEADGGADEEEEGKEVDTVLQCAVVV